MTEHQENAWRTINRGFGHPGKASYLIDQHITAHGPFDPWTLERTAAFLARRVIA